MDFQAKEIYYLAALIFIISLIDYLFSMMRRAAIKSFLLTDYEIYPNEKHFASVSLRMAAGVFGLAFCSFLLYFQNEISEFAVIGIIMSILYILYSSIGLSYSFILNIHDRKMVFFHNYQGLAIFKPRFFKKNLYLINWNHIRNIEVEKKDNYKITYYLVIELIDGSKPLRLNLKERYTIVNELKKYINIKTHEEKEDLVEN